MKENNLLCNKKKARKKIESIIKTTYITSKLGINLIRDIEINKPFQVIQTDFTELITISGKYKLLVFICNYTKYILSWDICESENVQTLIKCIKPVLTKTNNKSYIHQDQGSAYTSNRYIDILRQSDLFISYSEVATPTDNGEMESFFGRLKEEWAGEYVIAENINQLKKIITKAINYYNNKRIHTTIKSTPINFLIKSRTKLQKTV